MSMYNTQGNKNTSDQLYCYLFSVITNCRDVQLINFDASTYRLHHSKQCLYKGRFPATSPAHDTHLLPTIECAAQAVQY
jgi:hypothetical protein